MKLKLKDLNPNPFKKEINGGKLDEDNVKKIQANIKELGLMGSLPIFKKDNKYYLIAGHHRVEALKRQFGKNFEIDIDLKNYNEDQILRGMVVENLTQRDNEHNEETSNVIAIKNYLTSHKILLGKDGLIVRLSDKKISTGGRPEGTNEFGSISQIALWLDKDTGDVMRKSKINDLIQVYKELSPKLREKIHKVSGGKAPEDVVTVNQATELVRTTKDHNEQEELWKLMKQEDGRPHKLLTNYKQAPDEIKTKVLKGEVKLDKIEEAIIDKQIKESNQNKESFEFIPSFDERLREFSYEVDKLEQQVSLFRKIFKSNTFSSKYNSLGNKERKFLDTSIYGIQNRVKKCHKEVDFFAEQLDTAKRLEEKK